MLETILRREALDKLAEAGDLRLARLPPMTRLSLRLSEDVELSASAVLGLTLPAEPCRAACGSRGNALWLGPDEWLILAKAGDGLKEELSAELGATPHSLVDISHRQTALAITGAAAAAMLSAGCPLDLDPGAFPVGMCTRTLFAKVDIVLWRTDPDRFHLEVWRSFAPYLWNLLTVVGREHPYQSDD